MSDDLPIINSEGGAEPGALENLASTDSGVAGRSVSLERTASLLDSADLLLGSSDLPSEFSDLSLPSTDLPTDMPAAPLEPEETNGINVPGGSDPGLASQPPAGSAGKFDAMRRLPAEQIGGIEILIQMAEKGEIDPKNIDIIDVTDRFLKAIAAAPKENLRQSGKIIFQASVLLRMKAEALLAARVEEDMGFGDDDFMEYDADGMPLIFDANSVPVARQITLQELERALVRQTKHRQMRHRRVTLEQLIEALRDAERADKNKSERKVKPTIAVDGYAEMRDMDDILELAHDEDIEDTITRIERLLVDLLESDNLLPLSEIIERMKDSGHWVDVFLAVLFLANAGKISLHQEQFYGPLFVTRPEQSDQIGQTVIVPPVSLDASSVTAH